MAKQTVPNGTKEPIMAKRLLAFNPSMRKSSNLVTVESHYEEGVGEARPLIRGVELHTANKAGVVGGIALINLLIHKVS